MTTDRAPAIGLPLGFMITGLLSLLATVLLLVLRPDLLSSYHYNQYILAVTHLFILGFLLSVVSGALYQLVPVALETSLFSERLARWHLGSHSIGFLGMTWMFWVWNLKEVGYFGSVLAFGAGLFVYNMAKSLRRIPRWDVVALSVVSALVWLSLTLLAGLYLAADKSWNFSPFFPIAAMHAHAHLGAVGVFVMLIVGFSYRLIPMFTLGELQNPKRALLSIALLNLGLAGLFPGILLERPWKLAFALIIIAGLALHAIELIAILRRRRRRSIDPSVRSLLVAIGLFAPLSILAVVLCWPGLPTSQFTTQLENVYGFLGLFGVVTLAILGMLHKIVPFLVWNRRYSSEVGLRPVPTLSEMYSQRIQGVSFWLFLAGLLVTSVATAFAHSVAVRSGVLLLAASLALVALNMIRILAHLRRSRPVPLQPNPLASPKAASTPSLTAT
jgi:hypothetical protein